ncbi:Uncharacterised protein [Achromobacter xylosoxidans]|uniref:hypothetical protein n=1 Tax=Alcaligenes xylosoxydans xylosoxydans TaxID=85698 RepID=UPI0006C4F978|nr:hypothetical protein [Achromobacter xylosoxidans]CUJ58749.1 Uncharacterised protein [Achromobacter xylosoxidans]
MTTKHTPGPWYLRTNRHPETDGRPWGWLDLHPPGSTEKAQPSGVRVTWTKGDRSEANARLIAAAPELLEALEWALRAMEARNPLWAEGERFVAARAAIAKAKGEQQ